MKEKILAAIISFISIAALGGVFKSYMKIEKQELKNKHTEVIISRVEKKVDKVETKLEKLGDKIDVILQKIGK